jgi:hypothetical protein
MSHRAPPAARDWRPALAGAALLAALVAPALASIGAASDYAVHAQLGAELAREGRASLPIPAPLFAWLVAAALSVAPSVEPLAVALAIGLASHLAHYGALCWFLQLDAASAPAPAAARRFAPPGIPQVGLALALALAAPIPFASAAEHNYYFGYVALATYHNPTIALLRPFALGLFAGAAALLDPRARTTPRGGLALAALAAAAALAKPSFSVALLPALALAVVAAPERALAARRLLVAVAAPTLAVLGFEYAESFRAGGASGLRIAPFAAFFAGSRGDPALKLLLSAAFPLGVWLCAPRIALRDARLRLAWLCAAIGLAIALLFEETGPRAGHGNFTWSAQISLFVLFAASARWIFGPDAPDLGRRRSALVAGLLALHALCGLVWLGIHWLPLLDASAPPLREWF